MSNFEEYLRHYAHTKRKKVLPLQNIKWMSDIELHNEHQVFSNISQLIEKRKFNAASSANSQVIVLFWEIGKYINLDILADTRADYGKMILSTVSTKLGSLYGKSFVEANTMPKQIKSKDGK